LLREAKERFGASSSLPAALAASLWQGQFSLGLGYSTNYNQGIKGESIPLLINGNTVDFEIARPYRPYGAAYHQQSLDLAYRSHSQSPFEARASAMHLAPQNQTTTLSTYSSYQLELAWHSSPDQRYTLSTKTLHDSENGSLRTTGLSGQYRLNRPQTTSSAQWFIQAALEQRQADTTHLSYQVKSAQLRCDSPLLGGSSVQVKADIEVDNPQNLRPGRSQTRTQLTTVLEQQHLILANTTARFSLRLAQATDEQPYSALFGSTRRQTFQTEATVSLNWPIGSSRRLQLMLRHANQQSSLALFNQQETQINTYLIGNF
jgi:hypothetical protein